MTCTGRCRNRWHSTDCTTGPNYLKSTLGNGRVVWLSTDSSLAADGTSRYKAIQLYRQCLNSEPRCEPACKPEHLSMKTNSWWKKQTNKQTTDSVNNCAWNGFRAFAGPMKLYESENETEAYVWRRCTVSATGCGPGCSRRGTCSFPRATSWPAGPSSCCCVSQRRPSCCSPACDPWVRNIGETTSIFVLLLFSFLFQAVKAVFDGHRAPSNLVNVWKWRLIFGQR